MSGTAVVLFGRSESAADTDALDRAIEIVGERGAETVHGLYVVDTRRYGEPALSSEEVVVDELEDLGNELLSRFAGIAASQGLDVETRCCHGTPHEACVEYADDVGADLVVVAGPRPPHRARRRLEDVAGTVVYTGGPRTVTG